MKSQIFLMVVACLIISTFPLSSAADDFDGSKPLVCAAIFSAECTSGGQECVTGAPWMINFPVFMKIDLKAKQVTTIRKDVSQRTSVISHSGKLSGGHLFIQGVDEAYAWSALIAPETGSLTLGIVAEETGYLVFGACLPGT